MPCNGMIKGGNNKGQITIFVIIAILLVALVVLFFVFKDDFGIGKTSSEIEPIQTSVLSCLESTSEEGINYIALHGGYYKIPEEISMKYLEKEVPYYYINSKENIPSIERVERELEDYISENLKSCLNFSSFEEQGFSINEGNVSSSVNIGEDKTNIKANYPLAIEKGEESFKLKEFKTEVLSNIKELHGASVELVNLYSEKPGYVCVTCLKDISNKYNLEITATPLSNVSLADDDVIWFSILNSENELNWRFVVEQ